MDHRDYPVLYVDDDRNNRIVMGHNLGDRFNLLMAEGAAEALEILAHEPIAVLLTDQRMPRISGVDLAERAFHVYPHVVRIIITAYSDLAATIDAINRGRVSRFLKKPWSFEELEAVIRESIETFRARTLAEEMQLRLMELDRVAGLGFATMGVAHDMKQVLAVILPNVEALHLAIDGLVERGDGSAHVETLRVAARDSLDDITKGCDAMEVIIRTVIEPVKGPIQDVEVIDLVEVVRQALALTRTTIMRAAWLTEDLPRARLPVRASAGRLAQLVVNLLINAVQALDDARRDNRVTVRLGSSREAAELIVEDTGRGIRESAVERIFDPFFSTKGRGGTGLGLSICRDVVTEIGGRIDVQSTAGEGTRFTVQVPLAAT